MTGDTDAGDLTPQDWLRISGLLDDILDLPRAAQDRRLAELAAENPSLESEIRLLLASDRQSSGFLDVPAPEVLKTLIDDLVDGAGSTPESADESPPERVGPYRLVREVGRGGMGVVYLAERSDGEFEQQVALKLIKRGLDTDAILARFLRERQILARLQHRAIARLFDGGAAEDGRPYFAMEFVGGEPLTEACDRARMSLERRLVLFQRACDAVQYAHGQLIVHRDLKPSNILLTGDGDLKLLDFGIARLLDQDEESATLMTVPGTRPLTPAYAAPEQLQGAAATVGTDVYSLGVILCELICGLRPPTPPTGADGAHPRAAAPSALSTSAPQDSPAPEQRAAARRLDLSGLKRRLAGDLDAIVAKALHAEPQRRYASAEALSRDLDRHLKGLPVEAAPESALYRTHKFISRHRAGVASTCALVVALIAGLAGTTWQARQKAREARKAEVVKDFALGLFEAVDPALAQGDEITALELLEQGARRVEVDLAGQPEMQAEMEQLLGNVYWKLGQADKGLELLERGLARQPETVSSLSRANALRSKGGILVDLGRPDDAAPFLQQALAMHERTVGPEHPEVAEDLDRLVLLAQAHGDLDGARALAERSLAVRRESLGEEDIETADSFNNLGVLQRQAGDYFAAEESYSKALQIRQHRLGDRHPDTMDSLANFATLLYFRGKYAAARDRFAELVDLHDEVYGRRHPSTVRARNNLAAQLVQLALLDEAEDLYREVLEYWAETTGAEHPNALVTQSNLAVIERTRGRLPQAEALDRAVLDRARPVLGDDHPLIARFTGRLAATLLDAGQLDEAHELARRALEIDERAFGSASPQVAADLQLAGMVSRDRTELGPARSQLERALEIRSRILGPESVLTGETQTALGEVIALGGDPEAALDALRAGLESSRAELPAGHPAIGHAAWALGRVLTETGELAEADALLDEAHALLVAAFGPDSWRAAAVDVDLGVCRFRGGNREQGGRRVTQALERLGSELAETHPVRARATRKAREIG